jgi:hypothetical protein
MKLLFERMFDNQTELLKVLQWTQMIINYQLSQYHISYNISQQIL